MIKKTDIKNSKSAKATNTKKWFYVVLILIPIIIVVSFELILRVVNYGDSFEEWIDLTDEIEILNPEVSKKYFSGISNPPFSTESFLLKKKPINSFRIITLGASSGAGYPYQNSGSFTKYLRKSLSFTFPERKIEVSNVSMAAINSYTIIDLLPEILRKQPDLILIYLGHNEFYGALGTSSTISFGSSRVLTNLYLHLYEFRTFQILRDFLSTITSLFSSDLSNNDGTLMSKMAKEKGIEYKSDVYNAGLNQYKENLDEIISLCKESKVPFLIGTLASNLKDNKPFISTDHDIYGSANEVYNQAENHLTRNNISKADSLFKLAKDLDGLRFRAPEDFNKIIRTLAEETEIVEIDSFLSKNSRFGVIGNDLMVDHLHPNIIGYQLIGNLFYRKIIDQKLIEKREVDLNAISRIDSLVKLNYNFTKFDSTIADFRIKMLKNDWPYKESSLSEVELLNAKTIEDKVAKDVLDGNLSRRDARIKLASHYLKIKNYKMYSIEILALAEEFPINNNQLNKAAENLIALKKYELVGNILKESFKIKPSAFNTKWLGIMFLSNGNTIKAKKYLELAYSYENSDPQVLFNLAGAYLKLDDYQNSYKYVTECLQVSPNYHNAKLLQTQLKKTLRIN